MNNYIMIDGEGVDIEGVHTYILLADSTGRTLVNDKGITLFQALGFIVNSKESTLFSYYFNYDFTMMLKGINDKGLEELRINGSIFIDVSESLTYRVEYLPKKWLIVSEGYNDKVTNKFIKVKRVTVYDVYSFFQTSFVNAVKAWKIDTSDLDMIEAMKQERAIFKLADLEPIVNYCIAECKVGSALVAKLDITLKGIGVNLKSFHGPGAVANAIYKESLDTSLLPFDSSDDVKRAYFGGRIQCLKLGHFDRVHVYDINSAYPAALASLPAIGPLERVIDKPKPFDIVHIKYTAKTFGPYPFRLPDGTIQYPLNGEGFYHYNEYRAGLKYLENWEVIEVLRPATIDASTPPFHFVEPLYKLRQAMKEAGNDAQIAVKLCLNSLYGKLAQRVGYRGKRPRYQDYYTAGYITAFCRAKLLEAIAGNEDSIVHFATDGICSLDPLPLQIDKELGHWDYCTYESAWVFMPGIYYYDDFAVYHTRGFKPDKSAFDLLREGFTNDGVGAEIVLPETRFITWKQGTAASLGSWVHGKRAISLYPTKGIPVYKSNGTYDLLPATGFDGLSAVYDAPSNTDED